MFTTIGSFTISQDISYYQSTTRVYEISYTLYNGTTSTFSYSYLYDELGNITQIKYFEGATLKEQDDYVYDDLNQLASESIYRSDDPDTCIESDVCFTQTYTYDSRGNIESSTRIFNQDLPFVFYDDNSTANVTVGYNSSNYYDFYNLALYQTPSLTFYYFNPDTQSMYSNVTTTLVSSNLNTSVEGYYYRTYHARNIGLGIDIFFRIYFEVGTVDPYKTISYDYSGSWLDQLESYEVEQGTSSLLHEISYDNQGNPTSITNFDYDGTTYNSASLSWDGRQLKSITLIGSSGPVYQLSFRYNDQGDRTSKSLSEWISYNWVLQEEVTFKLVDDKVVFESNGTYGILYLYEHDGSLIGFNYDSDLSDQTDGLNYYYILDQQGDITKVVDSSGNIVASYQFDAYGNITSQTGSMASINPYTYRGYRFDSELSWYYLNSRYYVPEIGRFLSSDGLLGQQGNILSTNMYSYCANNPVYYTDSNGFTQEVGGGGGVPSTSSEVVLWIYYLINYKPLIYSDIMGFVNAIVGMKTLVTTNQYDDKRYDNWYEINSLYNLQVIDVTYTFYEYPVGEYESISIHLSQEFLQYYLRTPQSPEYLQFQDLISLFPSKFRGYLPFLFSESEYNEIYQKMCYAYMNNYEITITYYGNQPIYTFTRR